MTNDRAVSTAAPPSTEPVPAPFWICSQSWLSHMLIFKLYNNSDSPELLVDVEVMSYSNSGLVLQCDARRGDACRDQSDVPRH
ncbi:hypothetical protein CesoFtcFv8_010037 [Champsocephalus esox]|uniref:Uncharacterized protein n=1 Tax=Champsocephalus esox TaxID=159716 RepID=A0AAN8C6Q4_9TELE|nr:hypothetical protein CesoFtcFv8_010037 [Champsocephalus esox]